MFRVGTGYTSIEFLPHYKYKFCPQGYNPIELNGYICFHSFTIQKFPQTDDDNYTLYDNSLRYWFPSLRRIDSKWLLTHLRYVTFKYVNYSTWTEDESFLFQLKCWRNTLNDCVVCNAISNWKEINKRKWPQKFKFYAAKKGLSLIVWSRTPLSTGNRWKVKIPFVFVCYKFLHFCIT